MKEFCSCRNNPPWPPDLDCPVHGTKISEEDAEKDVKEGLPQLEKMYEHAHGLKCHICGKVHGNDCPEVKWMSALPNKQDPVSDEYKCIHGVPIGHELHCSICGPQPSAAIVSGPLKIIMDKCEQYWNEPNIGVAEIHAALELIHHKAVESVAANAENEKRKLRSFANKLEGEIRFKKFYEDSSPLDVKQVCAALVQEVLNEFLIDPRPSVGDILRRVLGA